MNIYDYIEERAFSEGYTQRMFDEAAAAEGEKAAEGFLSKLGKKVKATWNADAAEGSGNFLSKSKIGNRAAIIGIPTLTAAGIGYGVYRHKKKKREAAAAAAAAEALEEAAEAQKEYSNYLDYRMYSDDDEPEVVPVVTKGGKVKAALIGGGAGAGAGALIGTGIGHFTGKSKLKGAGIGAAAGAALGAGVGAYLKHRKNKKAAEALAALEEASEED